MATKNPRINITLDEQTNALLKDLAKNQNKSVSNLAKDLLLDALERCEDRALCAIAESRDVENAKRVPYEDVFE